jgi:predicted phage terminase large subunit-like protein
MSNLVQGFSNQEVTARRKELILSRVMRESLLCFAGYFFEVLEGTKMRLNWHHYWYAAICEAVYKGELQNVIINVSPGSTKSLFFSTMFPAWCYAKNPHCRFLCTSFADDRVEKNSVAIKNIMSSKEYKKLFPGIGFKQDSNKKKDWVAVFNGEPRGEYMGATMMGGITGNRAGFMEDGFTGAIVVDDPLKPLDAWSDAARKRTNNIFNDTLVSRFAHSKVPLILIMQRLHVDDCTQFLLDGGMGRKWTHIVIPARLDNAYIESLPDTVRPIAEKYLVPHMKDGVCSYWPYKEPLETLACVEEADEYMFAAQYMQDPAAISGDSMFPPSNWVQEDVMPSPDEFDHVAICADTALKTQERHDFSVFTCYGMKNNLMYIINVKRGKWEAPELLSTASGFWYAAKDRFGSKLKCMYVEDKASGSGLVQTMTRETNIPVIAVQRNKDKVSRARDVHPYIAAGRVHIPVTAPWKAAFMLEFSQFNVEMTHKHDDIIDTVIDAVETEYIKPNTCIITTYNMW